MRVIGRFVIGAACFVGLCGFLNLRPVDPPPGTKTAYQGKPLHSVTHVPPTFLISTFGDALTMSGGAMVGRGANSTEDNGVEDPSATVLKLLAPALGAKMGTIAGTEIPKQNDNEPDEMAKLAGNTGVVLDVETSTWMMDFGMFDPKHYTVTYYGRARLIDGATGKVVSAYACKWDSGDANPTYDELIGNAAAGLKTTLAKAAADCTAQFLQKLTD